MHFVHAETFWSKLPGISSKGQWAAPTRYQCLAQGHLKGDLTVFFQHRGYECENSIEMTELWKEGDEGGGRGGGYSASLTYWIAHVGCALEKVQVCVRSKVWLGLLNRRPLYRGFAAVSHISQQPWLAPSSRFIGEMALCGSWLNIAWIWNGTGPPKRDIPKKKKTLKITFTGRYLSPREFNCN